MFRFLDIKYSNNYNNMNPSVICIQKDNTPSYYVTKETNYLLVCFRTYNKDYHNSQLILVKTDLQFNVLKETEKTILSEKYREDLRFFIFKKKLWCSYSLLLKVNNVLTPKIKISEVCIEKLTMKDEIDVDLNYKKGESLWQKNWIFYEKNNELIIFYLFTPLEIYKVLYEENKNILETTPLYKYNWSVLNDINMYGSTNVIQIRNELYLFIHSNSPNHNDKYNVYTLVLDIDTLKPIKGSKIVTLVKGRKIRIIFPCGCIYDDSKNIFYIISGINDRHVGLYSITKEKVDNTLISL